MSDLTRRDLLLAALATPLVFGLPLRAHAEDDDAWEAAMKAAKARRLPVVVLVIPEDDAGKKALAANLERLLPPRNEWGSEPLPPAASLFLEAVWVCAPAKKAGANAGETAVLLDETGKRVAGASLDLSTD